MDVDHHVDQSLFGCKAFFYGVNHLHGSPASALLEKNQQRHLDVNDNADLLRKRSFKNLEAKAWKTMKKFACTFPHAFIYGFQHRRRKKSIEKTILATL